MYLGFARISPSLVTIPTPILLALPSIPNTKLAIITCIKMKKVMYYYDDDVGNYHYGNGHPMKPHRMRMAHSLLKTYNVLDQLDIVSYDPNSNVEEHFSRFHTEDYIDFLRTVNPENQPLLSDLFVGFNMGEDCPVFDGLYDFCKIYSHGSLMAATYLNE